VKYALPVQRGNVSIESVHVINAMLYICENGCKWRRLPKEYGKWHPIYKRFRRWVEDGIIDKLFRALCARDAINSAAIAWLMDSMSVPVHPDACGALKNRKTIHRTFKGRINHQQFT